MRQLAVIVRLFGTYSARQTDGAPPVVGGRLWPAVPDPAAPASAAPTPVAR